VYVPAVVCAQAQTNTKNGQAMASIQLIATQIMRLVSKGGVKEKRGRKGGGRCCLRGTAFFLSDQFNQYAVSVP
jgi:hypothetical protein